tara:strand:- start:279 stop:743 length:465 start_codon:yes stop_codon:yes gene_type:complete
MRLTDHFTLAELCKSETAVRNNINNIPDDEDIISSLRSVCVQILEPVRKHFDTPFAPNSGYRSSALNKMLGSKETSQHRKGQAVDLEVPRVDNYELALWISENCNFDQLILEFYKSGEPSSGWVHASFKQPKYGNNRRECLTYDGGVFVHGLKQ